MAVDEAHCISVWGHDFRPDYLKIGQALEWLGRPQTIALTATATGRVREDIVSQLRLRAPRQFITGFDRKNLFFEVLHTRSSKEKLSLIAGRLEQTQGATIVYTGTRKSVESIVKSLDREDIEASGYHAGMEDDERNRIQEAFMEGRSRHHRRHERLRHGHRPFGHPPDHPLPGPRNVWRPIIRSAAVPAGMVNLPPVSFFSLHPTEGFRNFSSK